MRIIFMGTPDFAASALEALAVKGYDVVAVISQPDSKRGRGKKVLPTPVKEIAEKYDFPVFQPDKISKDPDTLAKLRALRPDLGIVAAYGQILSKEVLEIPRLGCINIHASLLPRYRGAAPIQRVILDGEEKTGITIMQMAEGLDAGDMISKSETLIGDKNFEALHDELAAMGAKLLLETLPLIEAGKIKPEKQDDSLSTYAAKVEKSEGELDFSKSPVILERTVRAYYGAYTFLEGEVFKVWKAECADIKSDEKPGTVLEAGEAGILVSAGGKGLRLLTVQAAGKKKMSAGDFLRGKRLEKGVCFGR